jgi:epoxyqueuosine reductase
MSKFHNTISRRNFMKGIGLAGAGLGAAAAASPVFHDLDEMTSSLATHDSHDWFVSERDYGDITTPIDWNVFKPYDRATHPVTDREFGPGGPVLSAERKLRQSQGAINHWPGSSIRDLALNSGVGGNYRGDRMNWDGCGGSSPGNYVADGQTAVPWNATPEDNLQSCRAAGHFYGSPMVGAIKIDANMKKLFNKDAAVWENIDEEYKDDNGTVHIPNKCQWILVWMTAQNFKMNQYITRDSEEDPWTGKVFRQGKAGENQAYSHAPQVRWQINRFVKSLGYKTIKPSSSSNIQFGAFSGINEMGRAAMTLQPDYGMMVRYIDYIVTDLPLAPTKPIDAGLRRFCKDCATCAKICPSGAQNMDKDPSWETVDPASNEGLETWYLDWDKCIRFGGPWDCVSCQTSCPFNHGKDANIHPLVKAIAGTTPIFNGFFANMEDAFGYYGQLSDQEHTDWWYRDLKTWPYDTLLGVGVKEW